MKPLRKATPLGEPRSRTMLATSSNELPLRLDDVVIVFACNEYFVPYMSVAIESIIENVSPERHYDIIVLTRDISPTSMITLTEQATKDNVDVGFLDVDAALGDLELPHHGHFRPETYFRLLAPTLLPNVKKAIYLDSDLVVCKDVSPLFDTDVDGYLLAATRDADTIGQIDGYDATVEPYLKNELGMDDPHDYFQAGVLLMNLEKFRQTISAPQILHLATEREWRWLDQDVLNKVVNGRYRRVHMKWNYLVDWQHMRRTHIVRQAPIDVQLEYDEAREERCIVHYAGPDNRPWLYPDSDLAELFWYYAAGSPYLDELRGRLAESRSTAAGLFRRAWSVAIYHGVMRAFDYTCPGGSKRRENIIKGYMFLGGTTG
ncbi:MAG: glycosyltransferase family 8 protein [Tractidigestivibacter sp.]|jgi:lipopolysaccharide biosynthesis glycosyltransferase|uniref:glycosyltransferase family 8 protein n=1 Tax=Tractidigestivibacter sp. TaxID=2847320 RepID=UPI003D8DEA8D